MHTVRHLLVPQLECAAVFRFPVLVQEEQQVDPAVQSEITMESEIGMDIQLAAR